MFCSALLCTLQCERETTVQLKSSLRSAHSSELTAAEMSEDDRESCPLLSRGDGRGVTRRGSIRFSVRSSATFVEPEGPDGGWGWLVVLAGFTCLCVLDGAAYTFGVFIDPLIEEMGGGRGQTSLAGSLLVSTYAFTGPLASRLVNSYGTRKVSRGDM